MHGEEILNNDFKEFVQLLNINQGRFLVIGGYAVAFHGYLHYITEGGIFPHGDLPRS
jgi:hypothetical protein